MKKGLKIVLYVFISLVCIIVAASVVIKLNMSRICIGIIDGELNKISEKNPGIKFETGYLDEGILSKIALNDLSITVNGKPIIKAEKISLHTGLFNLVKEFLETGKIALQIRASGMSADIDGGSLVSAGIVESGSGIPDGRLILDCSDLQVGLLVGKNDGSFTVSPVSFESSGFISTDVLESLAGDISTGYSLSGAFSENLSVDADLVFSDLLCEKVSDLTLSGKAGIDGVVFSENPSFDAFLAVENKDFGLSAEAFIEDSVADIKLLDITARNFDFRYKGTISLSDFIPEGSAVLEKAGGDKVVFIADLQRNVNGKAAFGFVFPDYPDISYSGVVESVSKKGVSAGTYLNTKYQKIPLDMNFDVSEMKLLIENKWAEFNISLSDGSVINADALFDSFEYIAAEDFALIVDGAFSGRFDIVNQDFSGNLDDFRFRVSDLFFFGFDMNVNEKNVYFSDILVGTGEETTRLRGDINLGYNDLKNLVRGNSEEISFATDLNNDGTEEHLRLAYDGETFLADIILGVSNRFVLQLMFDRSNNLMGRLSFNDLSFDAEYRRGKVRIYNPKGSIGIVKLEDLNIEYDIESGVLSGDGIISTLGKVKQGGSFEFSGKMDEFDYSSISSEGLVAEGTVNVSVFDAYMGEDFDLKGNSFECRFTEAGATLTGDLINGYIGFKDKRINLSVDREFLFGFDATGYYGEYNDIMLSNIYFPIAIIDQFIKVSYLEIDGDYLEGDVCVKGSVKDPSFYGMLYSRDFNFYLYWIPDQKISAKGTFVSLQDHSIRLEQTPVVGYRESDHKLFNGTMKGQIDFNDWSVTFTELDIVVPDDYIEFSLPIYTKTLVLNINGEANGKVSLLYDGDSTCLNADLSGTNTLFTFAKREDVEGNGSSGNGGQGISANINLTTGKNFALAYPDEENAFISFNIEEGEKLSLSFDSKTQKIDSSGTAGIKTGRIYYFSNDFIITDGTFSLNRPLYDESSAFMFSVDLTAKIKELDSNGNPVEIYLILKDSNIPDIQPHLESSPYMTENEILETIKQDFTSGTGLNSYSESLSSIASSAVNATDALSTLGITDAKTNNFSISSQIRNVLNLDMFSLRLPFFQNFVVSTISNKDGNISLPAKIMNGTSLFAGKYFAENLFGKISAQLKASDYSGSGSSGGVFVSNDLMFNFELSLDWENPLGTYSFFVQPQELSVSSFLDTIGFSFTYNIKL